MHHRNFKDRTNNPVKNRPGDKLNMHYNSPTNSKNFFSYCQMPTGKHVIIRKTRTFNLKSGFDKLFKLFG